MAPSEQASPPRQRNRQPEQIRPIWTGLGTLRVHGAVLEKKGWAGDEEECGCSTVNRQLQIFLFRGDLTVRNKGFAVQQNASVKQRECMLPD